MERVLIVAKTRMNSGVCVSGLVLSSSRGIRLVPQTRQNQPTDTEFEVGQIWDIEYNHREITEVEPPHTEDAIIFSQKYVEKVANLHEILIQRVQIWQGGPEHLFDGKITLDGEKAYIEKQGALPNYSTGYWIPSISLTLKNVNRKPYYCAEYKSTKTNNDGTKVLSIPFVGLVPPVSQISPGTLVRVSLARWLPPYNNRCYLQVSGWYF